MGTHAGLQKFSERLVMEKFFGMEPQKFFELKNLVVKVFSELKDNKDRTPIDFSDDILEFTEVLPRYDIEITRKAFEQYMRHNMFIPTISNIITIIDPKDNCCGQYRPNMTEAEDFVQWQRIQERKNGKLLFGGTDSDL